MTSNPDDDPAAGAVHEARPWRDKGWTACVIENEDDEGWSMWKSSMIRGVATHHESSWR